MNAPVIPIDSARGKRPAPPPATPKRAVEPHSAAIEAAFLDVLMSSETADEERRTALAAIAHEHLHSPPNQAVLDAIADLVTKGVRPDPIIVAERLRGVPGPTGGWQHYLTVAIPQTASGADAPPSEYAKILLELWRKREAIKALEGGAKRSQEGASAIEVIAQTQDRLAFLAASHAAAQGPAAATTSDIVRDVWADLAHAESGKALGVSWGFVAVDKHIGRLQQPQYVVVGGRSGQGKTQITWQTCMNITDKRNKDPDTGLREAAYYGSFEMAKKPLLLRAICVEANYPQKLVLEGKIPRERNPIMDGAECPQCSAYYKGAGWENLPLNSRGQRVCRSCAARAASTDAAPCPVPQPSPYERLLAASNLISQLPVYIDDKPCPPRELAERFKRVRDLARDGKMKTRDGRYYEPCEMRVLAVDSIQDTPPPLGPSNRNRTVEIQDTSRGLMNIGKECNISVIGLAKLTRAIDKQKNKRPQLADIRECGDIEYQADEIFFVHREQYYMRENTPPEWRNIAELVHGKGRAGVDLEAPPARLWFSGGMFFNDPPQGWRAWAEEHPNAGLTAEDLA